MSIESHVRLPFVRSAVLLFVSAVFVMRCLAAEPVAAGSGLRSGEPLRAGTESGNGVFATLGISCSPLGAVNVYGGPRADLFVASDHWYPGLYLYRWVNDSAEGVPVFSQPTEIRPPASQPANAPGFVFADKSRDIFGVWLAEKTITVAKFDMAGKRFAKKSQAELSGLPRTPSRIAVWLRDDGTLDGFVSVPDGVVHKPGDHRAKDYTPYDGAGIWRGGLPRDGIYRFSCAWPSLPGELQVEPLLSSKAGGLLGISSLACIASDGGRAKELLFGTKLGGIFVVPGAFSNSQAVDRPVQVTDSRERVLRHPSVGVNMAAYPSTDGTRSDLIAGGEGGMYYYRQVGQRGPRGEPTFELPFPVLQESAELFSGSLVVPNLVDWNGDDVLDIVAGNAAGQLLYFENRGSNVDPRFQPAVRIEAAGEPILIRGGYRGSIQGPGEAHWGYTSPTVVDWNQDGVLDIVMNDIRGMHTLYLNHGSRTAPELSPPRELSVDTLEMHGTWRTRPAAGRLGDRLAYITLDDDDQVHLYWRIDDFNLEDGGKLRLTDGSPIQANFLPAGGTGRAKFQLVDWDRDGNVDLLVGTPRHGSFPEPKAGVPWSMKAAGAAVLLLRNAGTNDQPVYEYPAVMHVAGKPMHFGQHECAPVATTLGSDNGSDLNIVMGTERGRMVFIRGRDIEWKTIR